MTIEEEKKLHIYTDLLESKYNTNRWDDIYFLIEERNFLNSKAEYEENYQGIFLDIENYLLENIIINNDWKRFIQYILLMINLNDIAEYLGEEEIIKILLLNNKTKLTFYIINQIHDPLKKAVLFAYIIFFKRQDTLTESKSIKLFTEALKSGKEEKSINEFLSILIRLIILFEKKIISYIIGYLNKIPTDLKKTNILWTKIASLYNAVNNSIDSTKFWFYLDKVTDKDILLSELKNLLIDVTISDFWQIINRIKRLSICDDEIVSITGITILSKEANTNFEVSWNIWNEFIVSQTIIWTSRFIQTGKLFFSCLNKLQHEAILSQIESSTIKLSYISITFNSYLIEINFKEIFKYLNHINNNHHLISSALMLVKKLFNSNKRLSKNILKRVMCFLSKNKYKMRKAVALLYFEIISTIKPNILKQEIELFLLSPYIKTPILLYITKNSESIILLKLILKNIDNYTRYLSSSKSSGFTLRNKILIELSCKFCLINKNLDYLYKIEKLLLPDKQEQMFSILTDRLISSNLDDMAQIVCKKIKSRRIRLLSNLKIMGKKSINKSEREKSFNLNLLYEAMANTKMIESERLALTALSEIPLNLNELFIKYLDKIQIPDRKCLAFLDIGIHSFLFHQKQFISNEKDYKSSINYIQQAIILSNSDRMLLSILPELAYYASINNIKMLGAEFFEAFRYILLKHTVPWAERFDVLLTLIKKAKISPWEKMEIRIENESSEYKQILIFCWDILFNDYTDYRAFIRRYKSEDTLPLSFLIAINDHSFLPDFLKSLPGGKLKDSICSHLLLDNWIPGKRTDKYNNRILNQIGNVKRRKIVELTWKAINASEMGIYLSESIIALLEDKPSIFLEIQMHHLFSLLWNRENSLLLKDLARKIFNLIIERKTFKANLALKYWLNFYIAPNLGKNKPENIKNSRVIKKNIEKANCYSPMDISKPCHFIFPISAKADRHSLP